MSIPIREGYNSKGESVWFEWGIPANYSPWKFVYSWFDKIESVKNLPSAFQGFYKLCQDESWNEVLKKAIYWYILSNTLKNIDGSIVLAQTILELLAWNYLVVNKRVISQDTFSKISASEQFKLLLALLDIPLSIPDGLNEMAKEAKSRNLDGSEMITYVRNSLVHPGKKSKTFFVTSELMLETWNLALWYVELILLRLCDYDGSYASRVLGRARWSGEVKLVPWKRG